MLKKGFPPVITPTARILILGTFPSEISLKRQEYYANPRNQFWRVKQELFNIPADTSYAARVSGLEQNLVALWDVLHSCEGVRNLDKNIKNPVSNDFRALFTSCPEIKMVAFNGQKAIKWFKKVDISGFQKLVLPFLPSTSPCKGDGF
jgi:hypoxanthine-DNA glycosylase